MFSYFYYVLVFLLCFRIFYYVFVFLLFSYFLCFRIFIMFSYFYCVFVFFIMFSYFYYVFVFLLGFRIFYYVFVFFIMFSYFFIMFSYFLLCFLIFCYVFLFLLCFRIFYSGVHPASCEMGTGLFPGNKATEAWRRPPPHLAPRLKKECIYTTTPSLRAFRACSRANFKFTFIIIFNELSSCCFIIFLCVKGLNISKKSQFHKI